MTDSDALRARLVDELNGYVRDPAWLAAFWEVPREHFVPFFFKQPVGSSGWRLVEPPSEEWLRAVYSGFALVTQIDGDDDNVALARTGPVSGYPTSSSSAPAVMGSMLEALDVLDGHRVLEVGTGTGYNAGLLSYRLGPENVTSVDIDAGLVERAQERLTTLGYDAHVVAVDGAQGCPDRAPFDRIIATVALPRLPQAWIGQSRVGGKILVPLDLGGRAGLLVLLDVQDGGRAQGRFLRSQGWFMPVRANELHASVRVAKVGEAEGEARETSLSEEAATRSQDPFGFFAALRTGGYDWLSLTPEDGGPQQIWLNRADGSWVCHTTDADGKHTVRQGGDLRLWDEIESAHAEWLGLGQPARDRFGLTVDASGQHTVWLDSPEVWQRPLR